MSLKNSFFLDIFNKIIKVNENEIIIIFDKDNNIWFGLRDIIKALNYNNITKAITQIKISSKYKKQYNKILTPPGGVGSIFIKPNKKFINESGLYELLSISTKPLAKIFMNEYFTNVIRYVIKKSKDFFIIISIDKLN